MKIRPAITVALGLCLILLGLRVPVHVATAQTPTPQEEAEEEPANNQPGSTGFDESQVSLPNQPPSALIGQPIYFENCAPCHGQTGDSDGPVAPDLPNPPPLFSDASTLQEKSPANFFHTTKFGRIENLMPPWGNRLSDDEIWHAAAYAWSLHTDQAQIEAGQGTLEEITTDTPAAFAEIEKSYSTRTSLFLSQQALAAELTAANPETLAPLSEAELANVVDYVRTFTIIPPWGATYRAGDSIVEGAIRFTPLEQSPSAPLAELPITLNAYIQFENVATFETVADESGEFRFEGLSDSPNVLYLLETTYLDVDYSSQVFELSSGLADDTEGAATESITFAEIPVYETTAETDTLIYERVNWVVDYAPGEVIVGQILSILNEGDRTVVGKPIDDGGPPVSVELLLPADAQAIQFQDGALGERYVQVGNSVFDTSPVVPGEPAHQIFMSYRLPLTGNTIALEQSFRYPMRSLNLLVADIPDLEASVSNLTFVGAESVQNIPYRFWQGENLEPQSFQLELAGLIAEGEADPRGDLTGSSATIPGAAEPGAAGAARSGGAGAVRTIPVMEPIVPVAVGSVLFFLLAGLSIGPLTRMRETVQSDRLTQSRERLLREIAQLDDDHKSGHIDEEAWQLARAPLKEQLLSVAGQIKDASS